jgi:transcriptional regulator with XRE-family HTH domain
LVLDVDKSILYHFGMGILAKLRLRAGLSQAALAKRVHTSQPQICRLENDDRELTGEWAKRLAPHLDATPEEIVFDDRTVRIVGYVAAGAKAHYGNENDEFLGLAAFPRGGNDRTVAVLVRGDSLGPIFDGWLCYYDTRREPVTDDLLGEMCVIGLNSGQIVVKKLLKGRIMGHYDLLSGSGSLLTDQLVTWAAPVTAMLPPSAKIDVEPPSTPTKPAHRRPKARSSRKAKGRGK